MKTESLTVSAVIPAAPEAIYKAWMSSRGHSAMTGNGATVVARVGGKHTAWDGYIRGKTLELEPGKRIVQSWRTTDFAEEAKDSRLEVILTAARARKRAGASLRHTPRPTRSSRFRRAKTAAC